MQHLERFNEMHIGRRYFPPEVTLCFTKVFPCQGGLNSAQYLPGEASAMLTAAVPLGNAAKAHATLPPRVVWLYDERTGSTRHRAMLTPGLGLHSHCLEGGPTGQVHTGRFQQPGQHFVPRWTLTSGSARIQSQFCKTPMCPSYCRHILPTPRKSRGL